jgi:Tfp pilus assembly protein PilX
MRIESQRGAALVVGLIMLTLVTVMVLSVFMLSDSNLKSVGNMQVRNEAIAAANSAIEQEISSWDFASAPAANTINIYIDNNTGKAQPDYVVAIAAPVCVESSSRVGTAVGAGEITVGLSGIATMDNTTPSAVYNVVWEVVATATNTVTNATAQVRQGISRSLTQAQCDLACPPSPGTPCS